MDYRVEQLAAAAGVSVDTVRFYQARGLLHPPRRHGRLAIYCDEHAERMRRIRSLQQQGFTLTQIQRVIEGPEQGDPEPLLAALRQESRGRRTLSRDELAAESGIPVALIRAAESAGLVEPVRVEGEARFNEADVGLMRAGKPRMGHITLSVTTTEDMLYLTVKDDGAGLDLDSLRDKARDLGLIRPDQALTHDATVRLLFSSGVSTATEVTNVSGRGVGMDAVRRDIEGAGGRVTVHTEAGKGSTFTIQLPRSVSTQIIESFVVEVDGACYVLPIERVAESFKVDPKALLRLTSGRHCIKRHEVVLGIVDLSEVFKVEPRPELTEGILVAIESEDKPFAIRVDRIIGTQQVVVKELDMLDIEPNVFSGCAVMGDGEIALVLEADSLMSI